MKNKQNKYIKLLKDIYKNPRGKAILFFVFYFFFFLILIIMIRTNSTINNGTVENKNNLNYSLESITNGNYHYAYKINLNNIEHIYEGDKLNSKEKFTYIYNNISTNYYRNNDLFLKEVDSNWNKTENPYILKEFLNIDMLKTIITSSSYISKTEYESGRVVYHYNISTTTLLKLLENTNIDIDDIPNKIDITTNNKEVDQINYTLDSYCKYIDNNSNTCNIEMKYSNFDKITNIEL